MEVNNAKQRSSKVRKGSERSKSESEPRGLGTVSGTSAEYGTYQVTTGREDSNESNISISGEQPIGSIPGKIIGQLVDETEKQLAYHEQQAEILRERLRELNQIPNITSDVDTD
ncbi:hypothetical protein [Nostoc sp. CCY0012]|uniref:hypothetical protein n=1 Tax=Nostoc sp. CCY0012 TaxID=1056123 RepID=UPI0039C71A15